MSAEANMTRCLASLLQNSLGDGAVAQSGELDISLAQFAGTRHRIAPLLHVLAKQGHFAVDKETEIYLQKSYRHAGLFIAQQKSVRKSLDQIFSTCNVPYIELKGRALAEQLYKDPAGRFSKDIDILIRKKDQDAALVALYEGGFSRSGDGAKFSRKKAAIDMWALRDISLFDPKFGQQVELHQRVFPPETVSLSAALMSEAATDITPKISNHSYILYLMLHGAHTHWASLKWIFDMALLFKKITPQNAAAIFRLAESYHCTSALCASVHFIANILSGSIDESWLKLADEHRTPKSQKLEAAFIRTLLSTANSRVRRAGFPGSDWYIYDGGMNHLREIPRRLIRPFFKFL